MIYQKVLENDDNQDLIIVKTDTGYVIKQCIWNILFNVYREIYRIDMIPIFEP